MQRTRFAEEQVVGMLHEQEAGEKTADACRRHGVGSATFYWIVSSGRFPTAVRVPICRGCVKGSASR